MYNCIQLCLCLKKLCSAVRYPCMALILQLQERSGVQHTCTSGGAWTFHPSSRATEKAVFDNRAPPALDESTWVQKMQLETSGFFAPAHLNLPE